MNPFILQEGHGDKEVVGCGYLRTLAPRGPLLVGLPRLPASTTLSLLLTLFPLPPSLHLLPLSFASPSSCSAAGGKEWTGRPRRSGQTLLTFPQSVQAVENELVDGAADGTVVQRGQAAPLGQHGRELSRREWRRPQRASARAGGGAARGPH